MRMVRGCGLQPFWKEFMLQRETRQREASSTFFWLLSSAVVTKGFFPKAIGTAECSRGPEISFAV